VQLGALLEQTLTAEQYQKNVATVPGSKDVVEFAIKLPGSEDGSPVWLPIDSKFPVEDYERLLAAQERADLAGVDEAAKAIDNRLKLEAKTMRENTSRRRIPPTSPSCSCRPRACTRRRCAGRVWPICCSASTAFPSPGQRRCRRF